MIRYQTYYVVFNVLTQKVRVRTRRVFESDMGKGEVLLKITLKVPQIREPEQTITLPNSITVDSSEVVVPSP